MTRQAGRKDQDLDRQARYEGHMVRRWSKANRCFPSSRWVSAWLPIEDAKDINQESTAPCDWPERIKIDIIKVEYNKSYNNMIKVLYSRLVNDLGHPTTSIRIKDRATVPAGWISTRSYVAGLAYSLTQVMGVGSSTIRRTTRVRPIKCAISQNSLSCRVFPSRSSSFARGVVGCHPMSRPGDRLAYRIPS